MILVFLKVEDVRIFPVQHQFLFACLTNKRAWDEQPEMTRHAHMGNAVATCSQAAMSWTVPFSALICMLMPASLFTWASSCPASQALSQSHVSSFSCNVTWLLPSVSIRLLVEELAHQVCSRKSNDAQEQQARQKLFACCCFPCQMRFGCNLSSKLVGSERR